MTARKKAVKTELPLTDDDIERVIDDLRYVLRNAASRDETDRQIIFDLTKTIEELNVNRLDKVKGWDPSYGKVDTRDPEARRKALMRGLEEAEVKATKKRRIKREEEKEEGFSLRRALRSLRERLGGTGSRG
ncbi:MAG: hypothetical protein WED05_09455 [Candidatus Atabeyarchaeum deiterrae]